MPKMTVDVSGEQVTSALLPEDWYKIQITKTPELKTGKQSGSKYLEWSGQVIEGKFRGSPISIRTTLEKGDDPTKSKRWLFHQAMAACGIPKVDEKYSFDLSDLNGKVFYAKVTIKEESYNGETVEKNNVRALAIEPPRKKTEKLSVTENGVSEVEEQEQIPF